MSAKRYILVFSVVTLLLAAFTVAFNRLVDPFWYYRDFSIEGFNAVKPKFRRFERHVKPSLVQREQPASLVFGSSFAEIGFDPGHPALRAAGKSYNFALAGASWEMEQCSIQYAFRQDRALRQVVIGVHPGSAPFKDCSAEIGKMSESEERSFLFSYEAFEASINTVLEQRKQKPSHTAGGMYFYTRGVAGTASRFRQYFAKNPLCKIRVASAMGADEKNPASHPGNIDLSGLEHIVRQAVARRVIVKIVIYPRHALSFEQEYQCGIRQARWDALGQIAAMAEKTGSPLVEVWDFEGYTEIGTERISDAPGVYWQDPAHFNYEVGNIMLDEMFGRKQPELGMRLSTANVQVRAEKERHLRELYLRNRPEFLRQLQALLSP